MPHRQTIKLSNGTTYKYGKYSVTVGTDGSIRVKAGDWLSKYSAAIYGNFWTLDVFSRKDRSGKYIDIRDPHWIYMGETIYHMPTIWGRQNFSSGATMTAPPIVDIEKRKREVEHFKKEHPEAAEVAAKVVLGLHSLTEVAEILETLGFLSEGAGELASGVGIVLFPIHATLDVITAWKSADRHIGLRASAYGITAWAFGDPPPPIPRWLHSEVSEAAVQQAMKAGDRQFQRSVKEAAAGAQYNASRLQHAWTEGSDKAMKALDELVRKKNLKKQDCQVIFQAIGDDSRNGLAMKILNEMAEKFSGSELRAFWAPPPQYPSS